MLHNHFSEVFLLLTVICNSLRSSDVQNISFANKALQEFLKNYDQIQKILKFEDGLQSNSTSSENEDNSNISLYAKYNVKKKNSLFKQIKNISDSTYRPGTAGVYESDSLEDDDKNSKEIINQATIKAKKQKKVKNKVNQNNINANLNSAKEDTNNDNGEDSSEYDESEDMEEVPLEIPVTTDRIELKQKKGLIKNYNIDMSKKPKVFKNVLGEKTRFSIQHFRSNTSKSDSLLKNFRVPLKIEENSRRIKKVIYSETFSPKNIWQEIISRPIKLRKDKDPFIRNDKSSPNNDKITIVILTRKDMENNNLSERITDFVMNSEKAKVQYLRNTYGDTCLQVPIKKCNKVIKAVNKRVCKERFKCKSQFKSSLIENGKKACKKEFVYIKAKDDSKTQENDNKDDKIQPLEFRQQRNNDSFIDATRDRFFNKQYLRKKSDDVNTISLRNGTPGSVIQPKSLTLRDRYEKECQEENRKRCINACEHATDTTCSKHSCDKTKRKAFKKSCKGECHRIFYVDKDSDSDSSDSDSDSTESDGDSD